MKKTGAALLSVAANTALVLFKIVAGIAMGSVSVLSEGIHSGIDLIASFVALFSIQKSMIPADFDHPFGHGKFENISGFFEAILIFVAAAMIIVESVKKIFHPAEVEKIGWGLLIMLISVVVNFLVAKGLFSVAKRDTSIALEADALHHYTDVFTSLGVLAGLVVIHFTHLAILDPLIALIVAALIVKAAWDLTIRSLDDLADRSLPEAELSLVKKILESHPTIKGFHELRTRKSGNRREIDIHLQVDRETHVADAHDLCDHLESHIHEALPESHVTIHVEPDAPGA